jgi:5'-3' exonuclease
MPANRDVPRRTRAKPAARAPLLAVDGPLLLYRAYFAMPDSIKGADGHPVGALLGSTNYILQAVARHQPRAVVVCIGQETATYRAELYPPYHAHRPPMPDDLARQFVAAAAFYPALGWFVEMHEDLEADDLLATLAEAEAKAGGRTLVLTGDRDLYQLASDEVTVLYIPGGKSSGKPPDEVTPAEVRKRYGIGPELVPDFIALRGDPSDGLPGAAGIGEKTARDLLLEHGSLEGAIAGALRERPRVAEVLRRDAEELRRFKEIATVVRVARKPPPDQATDYASGAAAARERGMNALARRLEELAAGS